MGRANSPCVGGRQISLLQNSKKVPPDKYLGIDVGDYGLVSFNVVVRRMSIKLV